MKGKGIIIAFSLIAVVGATAIFLVLKNDKDDKKKKDDLKKDPNNQLPLPPKTTPAVVPTTKPVVTTPNPAEVNENYAFYPQIKALNKEIDKVDYALEIMCRGNKPAEVIHCTRKTGYNPELVQASWIQFQRKLKEIQKDFELDPLTKTKPGLRNTGLSLINDVKVDINEIMDPNYYNINQPFYKSYVAKGGTPIPV